MSTPIGYMGNDPLEQIRLKHQLSLLFEDDRKVVVDFSITANEEGKPGATVLVNTIRLPERAEPCMARQTQRSEVSEFAPPCGRPKGHGAIDPAHVTSAVGHSPDPLPGDEPTKEVKWIPGKWVVANE